MQKIGIDMVEVSRFKILARTPWHPFLKKSFSTRELDHCFSHADPAPHLAGIFAAKEAASKALGARRYPFIELEIRSAKDGMPEVWKKGKKLAVRISITHTSRMAAAVALG